MLNHDMYTSVAFVILTGLLTLILYSLSEKFTSHLKIKNIILKKQTEREINFNKLGAEYKLDAGKQKILKLSDEQLITRLQSRSLLAVQVLEAYIAKALEVNRKYNCITEFIPEAMKWAHNLDKMEKVMGPFHGIPISVKDNFNIAGMDSTLGFAKNLYQPTQDTATIVKVLMNLGAIPFCKTNVPQSLFTFAGGNPIFGQTLNYLNPKLCPGGSSAGEGCILAAGASVIGIGTDVGGSIRIPSHFSGVSGLKPTKSRLSLSGIKSTGVLMTPLAGSPGFIAKNISTLVLAYKHSLQDDTQSALDPLVVPIPWNEKLFSSREKLRIGYLTSDVYFAPIGDTEMIVLRAKTALEENGHILVPFNMPNGFETLKLLCDVAYADLGEQFMNLWEGEPVANAAIFNFLICRLPLWLRKLIAFLMQLKCGSFTIPFIHSTRAAVFFRGGDSTCKSIDLWKTIFHQRKILSEVLHQWKELQMDLLLSPVFPFPAIPYNLSGRMLPAIVYTAIWNLLDFPAGAVRFGEESGKLVNNYDNEGDFILRMAQNGVRESTGMPISVQLIGLPFKEEVVLRGMQILESLTPSLKTIKK